MPYCLDVSNRSGGMLVSLKSSILSRRLPFGNLCYSVQGSLFEINLRKEKWLVKLVYCPPSQNSDFFLNNFTKIIYLFANAYHNYLIVSDFKMESNGSSLKEFLDSNNLTKVIKSKSCFKDKCSCIDLILINWK